jgi:cell division protein FtsN
VLVEAIDDDLSSSPNIDIKSRSYIQVGAFSERENAYDYLNILKKNKFSGAHIKKEYSWLKPLSMSYLVQIGPINTKKDYDKIIDSLKKIGVYQTKINND